MGMHNPPHPGEIVRYECLEPLGLTVTRAAQGLGVTRQALSDLVNEKAGYRWRCPFACPRPLAPRRRHGLACRLPMTCGRRGDGPGKSKLRTLEPPCRRSGRP